MRKKKHHNVVATQDWPVIRVNDARADLSRGKKKEERRRKLTWKGKHKVRKASF